jgi:ABC-type sugar transport system permease subunit
LRRIDAIRHEVKKHEKLLAAFHAGRRCLFGSCRRAGRHFCYGPVFLGDLRFFHEPNAHRRTAVDPDFVGLQNYFTLFNPDTFFTRGQFGFSFILTLQFVLLSALAGQALIGLLLAWLSQAVSPALKSFLQTAVIAAWILPEVVIGFAWFAFSTMTMAR